MENKIMMEEGERLHQQFLADMERATPEQIAEANRYAEQHLTEYGCSFAALLHKVLKGEGKMENQTKNLLNRIAESWSREKDDAQPAALEHEIQYQIGCSYGAALMHANNIRLTWPMKSETGA